MASDPSLPPNDSNIPIHRVAADISQGSAQRLRAILETAAEGIITIDEIGTVESMNPAAERIFGYPAAEVIGQNVNLLMPSPYREHHDQYLKNYCDSGQTRIIGIGREVVGLRKDGTQFPIFLAVSEVSLPNQRLFTGFIRDISEIKNSEKQLEELAKTLEERNKELESIVYVASHDLRSPLVNVQGFSNELTHACHQIHRLIQETESEQIPKRVIQSILDADVFEALEFIQAGVKKMDGLISGLLRVSRLGRSTLSWEKLNMNQLLEDVARATEFQLQQTGTKLLIDDLPPCYGDRQQIDQVFSNLIHNSIKYRHPSRPCQVSVSGSISPDSTQVIYHIHDNGIGISPEHQQKIFEIFYRLNPSSSAGEGLGLTIALRIVERHHGKIWIESQPNHGTTFHVSLPNSWNPAPNHA